MGGRLNLYGGTLNLDGGTLTLDGGTRPPYNLSTACTELCCCVDCNNTSITITENEQLNEETDAEDEEEEA